MTYRGHLLIQRKAHVTILRRPISALDGHLVGVAEDMKSAKAAVRLMIKRGYRHCQFCSEFRK